MNIDIEAIVREEVRNLIREHLNIGGVIQSVKAVVNQPAVFQTEESKYEYEFPREGKTRRNAEEMALHKQEKLLERRLTPEEKGEIKARLHMDDSAENEAKENAIKKARIDRIAAEGMEAATKELELEAERLALAPESGPKIEEEKEETIPTVAPDNLPMVNPSLFTTNEQQI
jgi:hypothetical protein